MKKFLCTLTFACLIFLVGCGQSGMAAQLSSQFKDNVGESFKFCVNSKTDIR